MTMALCLLMALLLCPCAAETDAVQQYEAIGQEIAEVEAQIAALEERLTALKRQQADLAAQALAVLAEFNKFGSKGRKIAKVDILLGLLTA